MHIRIELLVFKMLISEYKKFMGGVDHNDQLLVYFAIR